jgi:hypothetical protein
VVELAEPFEPLVRRFGEEAPHTFCEDIGPQLHLGNGQYGLVITASSRPASTGRPDAGETAARLRLARPGVYDVKARIEDQG